MAFGNFLKQYLKNPRTVGAVAPSSQKLADKMVEDIDFANAACIVEYGPGTGVFTETILRRKKAETIFLAVEFNQAFYELLQEKCKGEQNFILVNGSAEHLSQYLAEYHIEKVDCIVSGLPFASLPGDVSNRILTLTKQTLKDHGAFITFQYTLLKMKLFQEYFSRIETKRVLFNLPPAHVLTCKNP